MSIAGRSMQPGDMAYTNYEGKITRVKIVRREAMFSQSHIGFQVCPALNGNAPDAWFDADWFEPVYDGVLAAA
jgi:hypothetical protein